MPGRAKSKPVLHLFRGAPCVRGWSKYQQTVFRWTLCGIKRRSDQPTVQNDAQATEDPSLVTCRFCHQLMRSGTASAIRPVPGPLPGLKPGPQTGQAAQLDDRPDLRNDAADAISDKG
jgi:hypothetical protein